MIRLYETTYFMKLIIYLVFLILFLITVCSGQTRLHGIPTNVYNYTPQADTYIEFIVGDDTVRTITLHPTGDDTLRARITFERVHAANVPEPTITIIDDVQFTYTPGVGAVNLFNASGWTRMSACSWCSSFHNTTVSYTKVVNAKAEYTFTGNKLEIWMERSSNKGKANIKIYDIVATQNIVDEEIDLYFNTSANNSQVVKTATFPQKQYKVTITALGTRNAASSDTNIQPDYIKIYSQP